MGLLQDIQSDILDQDSRVSTILRKAKVIAVRLKAKELNRWVDCELDGYIGRQDELPEYRKLDTQSFGHFFGGFGRELRNAAIVTSQLPVDMRDRVQEYASTHELFDGVRALESLVESEKQTIHIQWNPELTALIGPLIYRDMNCLEAYKVLPRSHIEHILDTIRNRLLNFVLEIETMNPEAPEDNLKKPISPETVGHIFNNIILGNNNVVAAGTGVKQTITEGISPQDLKALMEMLHSVGVEPGDLKELDVAIKEDGPRTQSQGFGKRVVTWIGEMTKKIVSGVWKVAIETAPGVLTKAIGKYYGWE